MPKKQNSIEFQEMVEEFGAEIAAEAIKNGGGPQEARKLFIKKLEAENKSLKRQLAKADPAGIHG